MPIAMSLFLVVRYDCNVEGDRAMPPYLSCLVTPRDTHMQAHRFEVKELS